MAYAYHSPAMMGETSQTRYQPQPPYQHQHQHQNQHQQQQPASSSSYPFAHQHQYHQHPASSLAAQYPSREMFYGNGTEEANENDNSVPTVNMAGFGARNFARKQEEARMQALREQQNIEEQQRARLAEERYHHAKRASDEEQKKWEREQRFYRREEEERQRRLREHQKREQRQREAQHQQHHQQQEHQSKAMSASSSPLPQHYSSGGLSLRELRSRDASSRPASRSATLRSNASSDAFWTPGSRSGGSGHQSSASGSSSSGASSGYSRLRPSHLFPARTTVYEDDYEETDRVKSTLSRLTRSSYGQDELPLAKCANCGDSLPFEELVGHTCLDKFESPLLARSGPSTPKLMTGIDMIRGASAPSRSPFLEKYAQVVEKSSSPLLQTTTLNLSSSPSPSSPSDNDAAKRVEELRKERIRKIEEQRAAKQMTTKALPNHHNEAIIPRLNGTKTHTPGSLSSSSNSSSKSSFSLSHTPTTPSTDAMTPSSSIESVKSSQSSHMQRKAEDVIRQARAERLKGNVAETPVKKTELSMRGIEHLLKDIHDDDDVTPKKVESISRHSSLSESANRPSGLNLTLASRSQRKAKKLCSVCLQSFPKNHPMVEKNGKIFCIDDYAELYLEKCRKCIRPVRDIGVRSRDGALSGLYHRDCFSCFRCNVAFQDGTFYIFDNTPYCGKHYHYLNGTTCHSCEQGIEGKCRQLDSGERFHPHCLTCQYQHGQESCKETLTDYYVVKEKKLCEKHFEKVQNRLLGSGTRANIEEAARLKAGKRMTFMQTFEARKGKA